MSNTLKEAVARRDWNKIAAEERKAQSDYDPKVGDLVTVDDPGREDDWIAKVTRVIPDPDGGPRSQAEVEFVGLAYLGPRGSGKKTFPAEALWELPRGALDRAR